MPETVVIEEIWKPVKGFESSFHVSNIGRIKSLAKWVDHGWGRKRFSAERIQKPSLSSNGYMSISIQANKKKRNRPIHVFIAEAFIEQPEGCRCVNHIDGNKLNNHTDNLEWTTYSGNINHAYKLKLRKAPWQGKTGKLHRLSKTVLQFDLKGNLLNEFGSTAEAARALMIHQPCISEACRRLHNQTYKGFTWKYKDHG